MNDSLNNLLNLIDDVTTIPSEMVTQILTKPSEKSISKEDKTNIKMVYDEEKSPIFPINCNICKRENTWKEAARLGWIFNSKIMKYICPDCI